MIARGQTLGPLTAQCSRIMSSFGHSVVEPDIRFDSIRSDPTVNFRHFPCWLAPGHSR
jgi:hypothetical protein